MTKDVMISIRGLQFIDQDSDDEIETIQRGQYYEKNGSRFLLYEEFLEGFREPVHNVMRFREGALTLTKRGLLNVQLHFAEGKKNLTSYQTPYGTIMIGVDTRRVAVREEEKELFLEVDYALEANYQFVADCHILVDVRPQGGERFDFFDEGLGEQRGLQGS